MLQSFRATTERSLKLQMKMFLEYQANNQTPDENGFNLIFIRFRLPFLGKLEFLMRRGHVEVHTTMKLLERV